MHRLCSHLARAPLRGRRRDWSAGPRERDGSRRAVVVFLTPAGIGAARNRWDVAAVLSCYTLANYPLLSSRRAPPGCRAWRDRWAGSASAAGAFETARGVGFCCRVTIPVFAFAEGPHLLECVFSSCPARALCAVHSMTPRRQPACPPRQPHVGGRGRSSHWMAPIVLLSLLRIAEAPAPWLELMGQRGRRRRVGFNWFPPAGAPCAVREARPAGPEHVGRRSARHFPVALLPGFVYMTHAAVRSLEPRQWGARCRGRARPAGLVRRGRWCGLERGNEGSRSN